MYIMASTLWFMIVGSQTLLQREGVHLDLCLWPRSIQLS